MGNAAARERTLGVSSCSRSLTERRGRGRRGARDPAAGLPEVRAAARAHAIPGLAGTDQLQAGARPAAFRKAPRGARGRMVARERQVGNRPYRQRRVSAPSGCGHRKLARQAAPGAAPGSDGGAYARRGFGFAACSGGHGEVPAVFCEEGTCGEAAMFCESHRKALSEAVLAGGRLPVEAEAHMALCAGCRQAFADERALLRRIEAGISSRVVLETPASLIPGVRERIAGLGDSRSGWRLVLGYATAALVLSVIAISLGMRGKTPHAPLKTPSASTVPALRSPAATPPRAKARETAAMARPRAVAGRPARRNGPPEVLISGDDRLGLERYVASFRVVASGTKATLKEEGGAEIKPIEIAELDVKRLSIEPLASGDSN